MHTSNLEHVRDFRDDPLFQPVFEYKYPVSMNAHRNEFGRIKTPNNYLHILVGMIHQEGCPWCAIPLEMIKTGHSSIMGRSVYCLSCQKCGSRGPSINIDAVMEQDQSAMDELKAILRGQFMQKRPWDSDLPKQEV